MARFSETALLRLDLHCCWLSEQIRHASSGHWPSVCEENCRHSQGIHHVDEQAPPLETVLTGPTQDAAKV